MDNKLISIKTLIAIAIGAALMFALNRFASIEIGDTNTYIMPGIGVLAAFAAAFGPVAGFLIGLIGHFLVDLSWGGVWWSWVISSAIFGLAVGYFWKNFRVQKGGFGIMQAVIFNGVQIAANVVVWVFIARTLDMIIYNEAFGKVSIQGFTAAGVNCAVVLVLGTVSLFVYSKTNKK